MIVLFALYGVLRLVENKKMMNKGLCSDMGCSYLIKKKKSKRSKACYRCYIHEKNVEDVRCVECCVYNQNHNRTELDPHIGDKITQAVWDFWHGI